MSFIFNDLLVDPKVRLWSQLKATTELLADSIGLLRDL